MFELESSVRKSNRSEEGTDLSRNSPSDLMLTERIYRRDMSSGGRGAESG